MKKIFTLISMAMLTLSANAANVVGDYKVWTFSDETTGEAVTGIIERDVLYIRGNGSHSVDFINLKRSGTFSDGSSWSCVQGIRLAASNKFAPAAETVADSPCTDADDRSVAITTSVPGTIFIAFRAEVNNADRTIDLYFNGKPVVSQNSATVSAQDQKMGTAEYTSTEAGTFFFGGYGRPTVVYVKFVPTGYVAPRDMVGTIVKESTTWIAPQDAEKDAELSGVDENGVADQDGLYLRGKTGSHSVKAAVENVETTIADETVSVSRVFYTPSNGNFAPAADASAGEAIKNATDMSLAVNIGAAGKLYVYLKARNISTEGRYVWVYKNGEKVLEKLGTEWPTRTYTVTNAEGVEEEKTDAAYELHEFDVDAAGASFFIGGNAGGVQVAVVKFVADEATGIERVDSTKQGDGRWYNLRGQSVDLPAKGIYIKDGKKYIFK